MALIDNETKKLIYTLGCSIFFLGILLWGVSNVNILSKFFNNSINTVTGKKTFDKKYDFNIDKNKVYMLQIATNQGTMEFKLSPQVAPETVNNLVNLIQDKFYEKSSYIENQPKFLLLGQGGGEYKNVSYTIQEEINADSLGFNTLLVGQYFAVLKNEYPESELNENLNRTVKEFYQSKGYFYKTNFVSQPIVKGSIVMYSLSPNTFRNMFFIAKGPIPEYEGRMTSFGSLVSGQDVLEKISNLPIEEIKVQSISIK